jgi:AAA domain, putative AbiEii toxin, Type IV TA system
VISASLCSAAQPVTFQIMCEHEEFKKVYGTAGIGTFEVGDKSHIKRDLLPTVRFQLPADGLRMQCPGFEETRTDLSLGGAGEQVPAVLDYLLRTDFPRYEKIVAAIRNLVPGFQDFHIATPAADQRRLDLKVDRGLTIPPSAVSVGVRMLIFFVTLAYHPQPPRIILIEEPENGVHPRRLADIMRLLREITEGKHGGQPSQVILTTHSPYLLDHVDIERDQVLVFRRAADGRRTAEPADQSRLTSFLDEFMLGEVWFNESEEGLVAQP